MPRVVGARLCTVASGNRLIGKARKAVALKVLKLSSVAAGTCDRPCGEKAAKAVVLKREKVVADNCASVAEVIDPTALRSSCPNCVALSRFKVCALRLTTTCASTFAKLPFKACSWLVDKPLMASALKRPIMSWLKLCS